MKIRQTRKILLLSVLLCAAIFSRGGKAFAATKTWTGAGSDENFSTSANWSPSGAPSTADDLVFDNSSSPSQSSPVDDMTNLSVSTITFTGTGLSGPHFVAVASGKTLIVTIHITQDNTVTGGDVDEVDGNIKLGGNVVTEGVSYDDTNPASSANINLNGNSLIFEDTANPGTIVSLREGITGNGTVAINMPQTNLQFYVPNTYSGTTNYTSADALITVGVPVNEDFGTSTINIAQDAGISFDVADSDANATITNTINIAQTSQAFLAGNFTSLYFDDGNGGTPITINVPNIVLNGDTRLGNAGPVTVNLAGITANGHCVEYVNDTTGGGSFSNGAPACVVDAAGTSTKKAPKTPNTGFKLLENNPAVILGVTTFAAFGILLLNRKFARQNSRR